MRQIERVLQPGPQMPAQLRRLPVQIPDLGPSDHRRLPGTVLGPVFQQQGQQIGIGGHARGHAHHEIHLRRGHHPGLGEHPHRADDPGIETLELGLGPRLRHHGDDLGHLFDRVVEQHRRPGPAPVRPGFQIVERARVAGGDLGPARPQAGDRPRLVAPHDAGGEVQDHPRAGLADGGRHLDRQRRVPAGQMPAPRALLAEMHMHADRARLPGLPRAGGEFGGRHRHRMAARIGQDPGQRAGDDRLLGHRLLPVSVSLTARPHPKQALGCLPPRHGLDLAHAGAALRPRQTPRPAPRRRRPAVPPAGLCRDHGARDRGRGRDPLRLALPPCPFEGGDPLRRHGTGDYRDAGRSVRRAGPRA